MSEGDPQADFLNDFTLSPDWAKKSSESHASNLNKYSSRNERESSDTRRGKAPFRRDRNRSDSRGRDDDRRQRSRFKDAPRRDLTASPGESPRREPTATGESPRREPAANRREDGGYPQRSFGRQGRQPLPPLPFNIRFLPDQKALSVIARKVKAGLRAIPLRDLVKLFYDNPDSVEVRLEFDAENKDRRFYSCSKCGWFALSEEALRGHLLTDHFDEYFDSETVAVDPPTGNFTCVGRCGFTGKLLAPPNHHSYNKAIQKMLRTACADTSEEDYRARIELIDTPEAIEQWKQEASQQVVYSAKLDSEDARKQMPEKKAGSVAKEDSADKPESGEEGFLAEETQPGEVVSEAQEDGNAATDPDVGDKVPVEADPVQKMSIEEAEDLFSRTQMPKLIKTGRRVTVTRAVSKMISDKDVLDAISRAWDREQMIQTASLFFAVRGGLRSRKLSFFRASGPRREEFVIHKTPTPLDPAHAAPELKQIIDYLTEHSGCTKTSLLADLIPSDAAPETAEEILKRVAFFIERGHMIEYFNGVLALAADHPHYSAPSVKKKQPEQKKDDDQQPDDLHASGAADEPVNEHIQKASAEIPEQSEPVAESKRVEERKANSAVSSDESESGAESAPKPESVTSEDDIKSPGENAETSIR